MHMICSSLPRIAEMFVRFYHVARRIVNAINGIIRAAVMRCVSDCKRDALAAHRTTSGRTAAHRKSGQRRVCLYGARLRKRALRLPGSRVNNLVLC